MTYIFKNEEELSHNLVIFLADLKNVIIFIFALFYVLGHHAQNIMVLMIWDLVIESWL